MGTRRTVMSTETNRPHLVITGVDGSEDGLRAARYAAGHAVTLDADLLLLHAVDDAAVAGAWGVVYDPSALQEAGQVVVEDARKEAVDAGCPADRVRGQVVLGNPAAVLADRSRQADLIVVGGRAASGLERMFVGSTSVAVSGMSACPVVVISRASTPQPVGDKKRIAVAVGPQSTGTAALRFGFEEAARYGATLQVITVAPPLPPGAAGGYQLTDDAMEHFLAENARHLQGVVDPVAADFPNVELDTKVLCGQAVDELVGISEDVDLLIVGMKRHPILGWTAGGVIRGIMAHSRSPLAVVH
ncbi:MAG: universal stress protein [Acidipropionibacterium acidipropionici]|nr:universal stress protein [Acidipropionibacterium acidipropionici]